MKKIYTFVIGCLAGAMLFGGGAAYAASGVLAERSAQAVYVDGRRVELETYNIDGSNYVKLRDIGQTVDFNVYWDGSAVQVESAAPYTGEGPPGAGTEVAATDFSAAANPAVFTELYTREAYNAAYEILEGLRDGDDTRRTVVHIGTAEARWRLEGKLGDLANGYTISLTPADSHDGYTMYALDVYHGVMDSTAQELIRKAEGLKTDKEKIRLINAYLCEKVVFDAGSIVSIDEIINATTPIPANCSSLARAMNYFCGHIGIPCIKVHGENHFWNLIYCDGEWSYTDVSLNAQVSDHAYMLFSGTARKSDSDPEGTRFLQELLVPGSTK